MVSFKTNNADHSEHLTPHRHLPGSFRGSLQQSQNNQQHNPPHRHEPPAPCANSPPPTTNSHHTVLRGCTFHPRLDQPVTSSSPSMDSKKVVQATATPPAPLQLRNKTRPDVAPSISGVRRRSGPNQGLRSPAAKRPVSAPVALQGWLHKQGSEGLMLWKKRWFVLSDYCLFYYKGPEEEKLLGSILLPSYRVTVCKPEDKINKKFAFKAEHANMRTYHFAADTRESMNQWVTALTLASLLQDPNPGGGDAAAAADAAGPADGDRSARPSVSSISSILNQSADDSDSGFHGFQSRDDPSHASNNNSSPNSVNTGSFPNMSASNSMNNGNNNNSNAVMHDSPQPQPLVNGWMQHSPQYGQAGPSQHHTQYNKMMVDVTQQQAGHPHSAMVLQQHPHQQQHPHMMQQHVSPQTHPHKLPMSPPQMQMQQPGPSNVHTVQPMPRNFGQPVYANAPPKPRRLNDNDYSTPSPDPEYRKSPVSPEVRVPSKSPMANVEYDRNPVIYGQRMSVQQQMHQMRTDKSGLNYGYNQMQPTERRTPDTYGRSAKPCRPVRTNGDYEDVYGGPQLYQRPAGPVGYNKSPAPAPMPVYNPQQQQQPQIPQQPVHPQYYVTTGPAVVPRQQRVQPPPRPHSADFLDYEATHKPNPQTPPHTVNVDSQPRCPQRPKSSLDIANPSDVAANDGYFYSEERTDRRDESVLCNRYAAQMRQSAVYLHQTPQHHQQQRNQSLSRTTTPSKSTASRDTESGIGTLSEVSCASIRRSHREHSHQQHSLPRLADNDAHLRRSLRERSYQSSAATREVLIQNECGTLPSRVPRDYESIIGGVRPTGHAGGHVNHNAHVGQTYQVGSSNAGARRWNEQQFARSASARLPRTRHPAIIDHDDDDDDYTERSSGQDSRDGDRKMQQREESMKRLLEWKQRMLQSPLTRKPSGSTNRGTGQNDLSTCYKQQALQDLAAHEASVAEARHSRRRDDGHRPHVRSKSSDGRRSVTSVPRYNSYSSDDEELGDVRRKRTRRPSHAGRNPRNFGDDKDFLSVNGTNQQNLSPSQLANNFASGISLDTGYEEVGFPTMLQRGNVHNDMSVEVRPVQCSVPTMNDLPEKITPPKKPLGILKTSAVYATNHHTTRNEAGKLSTLAGYIPGETWRTPKNVQWDSREEKEEWDPKIDENNVIKEFSYQYIKPEEMNENEMIDNADPINLVRSRIRSFESNMDHLEKEPLAMQEPLKVSPPQATEAHVSRIDAKKQATVLEFASSEKNEETDEGMMDRTTELIQEQNASVEKQISDRNKSVKDLLADFERKSQEVRREHDKQKEIKHRGVFSDTETLLYDTGSDLDQPERSGGEEEPTQFESSIAEYQDSFGTPKNNSPETETCKKIEDFDATSNPAYARLSVTESMVTHEDQCSDNSASPPQKPVDPPSEEHYLPMSPRKSILDPNTDSRPTPKALDSLFANLPEESSYVEMTQNGITHSLLAPDSNPKHDGGDYASLDTPHYEFVCVADSRMEPVYAELSQVEEEEKKTPVKSSYKKKLKLENSTPKADLPDILTALKSDSSDADDESSKDLDSIDAPRHPRFSLSDTFRPASYYLGASRNLIAELHDSSDSELVSPPPIPTSPPPLDDLDSLDMQDSLEIKKSGPQVARDNYRRNTDSPKSWNKPAGQVETRSPSRFSEDTISSTFRDSRMSLDSISGSDTVELRNPEEEARHRQMKRRPVSNDVCEVLSSLDELETLGSRFDGTSIDLDQYLEELQSRDAFNVDLYAKDLSYNSIYGLNENMLGVDKLQKATCQEIAAKMTIASSSSLDQPFPYGTRSKTSSASSLPSMRVSEVPQSQHQHSQSFTGDIHYENITRFSPLRVSPAIRPDSELGQPIPEECFKTTHVPGVPTVNHSRDSSYSFANVSPSVLHSVNHRPGSGQCSSIHSPVSPVSTVIHALNSSYPEQRLHHHSRSASQDSARYSLSPNHRSSSSQDSSQYPPSSSNTRLNTQIMNDPTGAPYYYSDLQGATGSIEVSRLPQLNNERGDANALKKRNDIGRIVNPIPRQVPRPMPVDDIGEARRIAEELRKTTREKVGLVDRRNFYESDTLRRVKSNDPLPDDFRPDVNSVNLYPHGLRDKSGSQTHLSGRGTHSAEFTPPAQASHRRSRSLEGLLDDVDLHNFVEQRNRANIISTAQAQSPVQPRPETQVVQSRRPPNENSFTGEDPWEQDALWRESLRRVSLRHARSLDNLDSPARTTPSTDTKSRTRITRGATYVNDSVAPERPRFVRRSNEQENEVHHEVPSTTQIPNSGADGNDNEDDAYESLAMDRIGASGYIWDPENEAYRKPTASESTGHFLVEGNPVPSHRSNSAARASASFEIDREKLRQWDLLSSACLLQEQQRTSMAESGRGLPATGETAASNTKTMTPNSKTTSGNDAEVVRKPPSQQQSRPLQQLDESQKEISNSKSNEWPYKTGGVRVYRK